MSRQSKRLLVELGKRATAPSASTRVEPVGPAAPDDLSQRRDFFRSPLFTTELTRTFSLAVQAACGSSDATTLLRSSSIVFSELGGLHPSDVKRIARLRDEVRSVLKELEQLAGIEVTATRESVAPATARVGDNRGG